MEFLAEKQLVTVVPNFSHDEVFLIGGSVGPFNAGLPVEVPLWMAVNLKQRQKCRIQPPDWMDIGRTYLTDSTGILHKRRKIQNILVGLLFK